MNDLNIKTRSSSALTASPPGNPDGKGVSGIMLDWYRTQPRGALAKPRRQILADLFTSMLVLSATFKFRPSVGVPKYLYWMDGEWSLSLISPDEWSQQRRAAFAGTCVLQRDMTWTIAPSRQLAEDNPVSDAIRRFRDAFVEMLDTDLALEEILPTYSGKVPYYRRLQASAVSRSLSASLDLGAQTSTSCRRWRALLPAAQNDMLFLGT
jgi:hypothetical protein